MPSSEPPAPWGEIAAYRGELTGYCYRMLGSPFEAEDAVQETLLRAWRAADRFEGRSGVRTWLYRIATNVCFDALEAGRRRARPVDLASPVSGATGPGEPWDDALLVGPFPGNGSGTGSAAADGHLGAAGDPAAVVAARESVHLAFIAALQYLPSTQRSVLLLREVLGFSAREVADLQGTSVAAVNSVLQRARTTLAAHHGPPHEASTAAGDDVQQALATRYADAFARYDMEALAMLLHVDATMSLPPYATWMRGPADIRAWLTGPAVGCRDSRLIPTAANGVPAFAQYRPAPDGGHAAWGLHVVETAGGRITGITVFRDTERLFPLFGMPGRLAPGTPDGAVCS
ncbi:sigma-70 family RNA polymerase sigma factor [Yinghuangia soli]|uniref:Sigma-70 family RNA polymerase sigma factor n=1 Tax=Yinghuangia soli TaxID=2908204 RepID=A0AA41PWM7_9ACTN|nr:sigma-70 family RNA polymerase sigma factor [Yinghuangia soli]MCF2526536.1 sigma-70 family RNA polymerase sigma factor [Yinghuangia soli]